MKIIWINPDSVHDYKGSLFSSRASVRLRCIEPANYLSKKGHNVLLASILSIENWIKDPIFYTADIYVIGKALGDLSSVIQHLKHLGKKVVIDVCDNVFEPPEDTLKKIYESILPLGDSIIVASNELDKVLRKRIDKNITVIPDHVEGYKLVPSFDPHKDKLNLLWFGYPNNLNFLDNFLPNLCALADTMRICLSIVTVWNDYYLNIFKDGRNGICIKNINWSLENMNEELNNCDIVIIPSSLTPSSVTKTANRVITSLYAGRYVVAYPIPAYFEFSPFISLGEDLVEGIRFSVNNPDIVRQRIANGQVYIENHYAPDIISQSWEAALIKE